MNHKFRQDLRESCLAITQYNPLDFYFPEPLISFFNCSRLGDTKQKKTPGAKHPTMQPECSHLQSTQGSRDDSPSLSRLSGEGDVRIQLSSSAGDSRENSTSRGSRPGRSHGHAHGEAGGSEEAAPDTEEQGGSSLSELRYLLQWLHQSLPYLLILCVKLLVQHITGRVKLNQLPGNRPSSPPC